MVYCVSKQLMTRPLHICIDAFKICRSQYNYIYNIIRGAKLRHAIVIHLFFEVLKYLIDKIS